MRENRILGWEAHLIQRASEGENVAFELLCDLHRSAIEHLAMRMLRSPNDVEDVVQETFLRAFRGIKQFDPSRPLRPWLGRICTNCCVDLVRQRSRTGEPMGERVQFLPDPYDMEDATASRIENQAVLAALKRMPPRYRDILTMRHIHHMEVNDIARELRRPEGTVKSWLFRARNLLRRELTAA